jgi:biopolymer transport protein ExbD
MPSSGFHLGDDSGFEPLLVRKRMHDDAEFDITAMIDLVFMMNIYFLVTFLTAALGEVNMPTATHVAALDADTAVTLTVLGTLDGEGVRVFLADGEKGEAITDADEQEDRIRATVEEGAGAGKTAVLIKAEKKVQLRDLFRISSAAAVEGIKLHVGVMEIDSAQ